MTGLDSLYKRKIDDFLPRRFAFLIRDSNLLEAALVELYDYFVLHWRSIFSFHANSSGRLT